MYKKEYRKKENRKKEYRKKIQQDEPNSITSMFIKAPAQTQTQTQAIATATAQGATIEDIEVIHEFFKLKYNINNLTVTPANSNQTIKITHDNIKIFEMVTDVNDGLSTINLTDEANDLFTGDFNTISGIMAGIITGLIYSTQQ